MENPLTIICRFVSSDGKKVKEVECPRQQFINAEFPLTIENDGVFYKNFGGIYSPDFPFISFTELTKQ